MTTNGDIMNGKIVLHFSCRSSVREEATEVASVTEAKESTENIELFIQK